MDKAQRKSDIGLMCVTAGMAKLLIDKGGVVGVGRDRHDLPYVHLMPWRFVDYFGEDTEFEYRQEAPDYRTMEVIVNGVRFFALITELDWIRDGRLV